MAKKFSVADLDFNNAKQIADIQYSRKENSQLTTYMKAGKKCHLASDWAGAVKNYNAALEIAPESPEILSLVAYSLVQLGVRDKAIALLEHVLTRQEPDETICGIMGLLATNMSMFDVAEKVWKIALQFNSDVPAYYVNLASALDAQDKQTEAIDMLQQILPRYPDNVELWNMVGVLVMHRDNHAQSRVFFEEAYRLNPKHSHVLNNLAIVAPTIEDKIKFAREALKVDPNQAETKLGLANLLIRQQEYEEGFALAECRHDATRRMRQNTIFKTDAPRWQGEALDNKTILVMCEQGIGDEILHNVALKNLFQASPGKVILTCDHRLTGLYERSYPECDVYTYADVVSHGYLFRTFPELERKIQNGEEQVDYSVPFGSLPMFFWQKPDDIPDVSGGFLRPEPKMKEKWKQRLEDIPGKLKVGLSWTSGLVNTLRNSQYFAIEDLAPLFKMKDVAFVNLQYANAEEGVEFTKQRYGVDIHVWDDFDIKMDIEENIALMSNLDLVIGPLSSPQMFSMAAGTPTWWITTGYPIFCYGVKDPRPIIYKDKGLILDQEPKNSGWSTAIDKVCRNLEELLQEKA